ncbi:PASTA domain-containing protein [Terrabacter sp. Soil810]|uniref:PASTA domain-containing protein n=1 Tax=Terrabacter sp. Soil810 TaxID=1736418 RepID=UPI000713D145|nr:PASTA domain-containing protein [Terrabacter sp. Soil810]KRF35536.1 hypothetical protein ASG96_19130 [Terrabacter sp. Soil810]
MSAAKKTSSSSGGTVVLVLLAIIVALVLLPIAGTLYGLVLVVRWLAARETENGWKAVGGAALVAASVTAAAVIWPQVFNGTPTTTVTTAQSATRPALVQQSDSSEPASAGSHSAGHVEDEVAKARPKMPSVVGSSLDDAQRAFDLATVEDLSPRDRMPFENSNWTVMASTPAAGADLTPGSHVVLWVLRNEEAAWLAKHPKMPKVKAGSDTSSLTDAGGPLAGMSDLVETRWAKGHGPDDASKSIEDLDGRGAPSAEPAAEVAARKGLKESYGSDFVKGQIPTPGSIVRPGRLLVILEEQRPEEELAPGDDYVVPLPGNDNDDDDDVNVPGWLCPTRFC